MSCAVGAIHRMIHDTLPLLAISRGCRGLGFALSLQLSGDSGHKNTPSPNLEDA
jgi:hypothetical protein